MQQRILIPLDGSPLSDKIIGQVRRLLVRQDREVVLLGIVEPPVKGEAAEQAKRLRDHLETVKDSLVADGALASVEVLSGDPAATIIDVAARKEVALVVMATHGRTGVARWVRGSVTEAVVRGCPAPVLVANPAAIGDTGAPPPEPRFGKILVPLDGSDVSAGILPTVETVARAFDSEVILLRVEWSVPMGTYPIDGIPTLRPSKELEALLEPTRRRLQDAGIKARSIVAYGPEAAEILDAADREQVDLVAMSTHGRSGLSRWLFGSVAEQVIRHCRRPLLVRRVQPSPLPPTPAPTPPPIPAMPRTLGARSVLGAKVKDRGGLDLGRIEDVTIDLATGQVTYAVLCFGGVLGVGEKLFPVPWGRLRWSPGDEAFHLQHPKYDHEGLKRHAPAVHRERWRPDVLHDLGPAVHSFYPGAH